MNHEQKYKRQLEEYYKQFDILTEKVNRCVPAQFSKEWYQKFHELYDETMSGTELYREAKNSNVNELYESCIGKINVLCEG